MSNAFLTAREIADILKISKALAYRLIAQGQIPSIRFGRVTRVRREDLEIFIQNRVLKPDVDPTARPVINVDSSEKGDVQQDT